MTNLRTFSWRSFKGVQGAIAELLWSLLEIPEVLRHESCESVPTLLTSVVYTSQKTMNDQTDLQRFLERYEALGKYSPPY